MRQKGLPIRLLALLCAVLALLSLLSGCNQEFGNWGKQIIFGDLNGETPENCQEKVNEDIMVYESVYPHTNSYYFANSMNEHQRLIYDTYIYALESGRGYVAFPQELFTKEEIQTVFWQTACDYPFLETNFRIGVAEVQHDFLFGVKKLYYGVFLYDYSADGWTKKVEAYRKAQEVVAGIPAIVTDPADKARYLYDWLVAHTEYTDDEQYNDSRPVYLYDAMIGGSTNCDGFANALSMMYNLADIPCFSVYCVPPEDSDGHAWNIAKLNDAYYHFDVTGDASLKKAGLPSPACYFRLSDGMEMYNKTYPNEIIGIAPACRDTTYDYKSVDVQVQDIFNAADQQTIITGMKAVFDTDRPTGTLYSPSVENMTLEQVTGVLQSLLKQTAFSGGYIYLSGRFVILIEDESALPLETDTPPATTTTTPAAA